MNLPPETLPRTERAMTRQTHGPTSGWAMEADWTEMIFAHFAFRPEIMEPHVPMPLDLHGGEAYVSLVAFRLENLRFGGSCSAGRWLMRPFSDHFFLNLRTYVVGPRGPGIHFLAEWISNRLSLVVGPRLYGLPYRFAQFRAERHGEGGIARVTVEAHHPSERATLVYPSQHAELTTAETGTRAHFLLERYTAYACARGQLTSFEVVHAPWRFHDLDWVRLDPSLIANCFPWFNLGRAVGGHYSPGLRKVRMSRPERHR